MFNDNSQKRNVRKKVGHCVHLNFFAILFIFTHCSEVVFFIYCMRIYGIYHLIHDFYALICAALYCLFFFVYTLCYYFINYMYLYLLVYNFLKVNLIIYFSLATLMRLSFICLKNFKINTRTWCIVNAGFLRGFTLIGLNKINLDFILL